jgi:polyphosphate kinase
VGRFLEHSRIFWFNNRGHHKVFIGSADIMERNLDRRIEVLCPIHDPRLIQHIEEAVLDACLRDTHCARLLAADGTYAEPASTEAPFNSQEHLLQWYATERRT